MNLAGTRTMLLWAVVYALLLGCGDRKAMHVATATDNAAPLTKGTVTSEHAAEGCPWLVRIDDAGGTRYLIPVALEDKYLRDGSHITFTYRPSRANSGNCGLGDPAILEGVKVIGR